VPVLAPRPEFGSRPAIHRRAKRARRGAEDDGFEVTGPVFLLVISVVAAALFLVVLVQPTSLPRYFFFGFPWAVISSTDMRSVAWAAPCSSSV
jgi:hypothetical protein